MDEEEEVKETGKKKKGLYETLLNRKKEKKFKQVSTIDLRVIRYLHLSYKLPSEQVLEI